MAGAAVRAAASRSRVSDRWRMVGIAVPANDGADRKGVAGGVTDWGGAAAGTQCGL